MKTNEPTALERLIARRSKHKASRLFSGAELKNHQVFVCSDIYGQVEKLIQDAISRMYEENNCDRSLLRELENRKDASLIWTRTSKIMKIIYLINSEFTIEINHLLLRCMES